MSERDYDAEMRDTSDHKYAYGFDFDVMHPLMVRSFAPFFRPGNVLELGASRATSPSACCRTSTTSRASRRPARRSRRTARGTATASG